MSLRALVFDTETTGVLDFKKRSHDPSQPVPIEVAWHAFDTDSMKVFQTFRTLISYPTAPPMEPDAEKIHGISVAESQFNGMPVSLVVRKFHAEMRKADVLIAHSYHFDRRMMAIAGHHGTHETLGDELKEQMSYCTMMKTTKLCGIPQKGRGGLKWPKLEEALDFFELAPIVKAHTASGDVDACVRLFQHLWKIGHVTEKELRV